MPRIRGLFDALAPLASSIRIPLAILNVQYQYLVNYTAGTRRAVHIIRISFHLQFIYFITVHDGGQYSQLTSTSASRHR